MFNAVYEEALAGGDSAFVRRVGQAYLAQLDSAFAFAERLSAETFGRAGCMKFCPCWAKPRRHI